MPVAVRRSPFERAAREGLTSNGTSSAEGAVTTAPRNGDWIETFLSAVMQGASVRGAVKAARIHITLPYKRRIDDEAFRKAWKEAAEVGTEQMEQEAARRAYHGTCKPVYYKGVKCGFVREYSDTLMMFLLKGRKPEVYRDGVEDSAARGSFVLNISVVPAEIKPVEESQLIEVQVVADSNQQDGAGIAETTSVLRE